MRPSSPPNIALVGCGAIAKALYLPAMAKYREKFGDVWLVDPSARALATAAAILPGRQVSHLTDISEEIHFVIVATPNHLHCSVALAALGRGAHVLIEKPFVSWPEEGRALLEAAATKRRVIAVNQTRRLYPLTRELRRRISEGEFGSLRAISHQEGTRLIWPFESEAAFAPGAERTGVIMDSGVHVVDLYQYLLKPAWTFVSAIHDGFCGREGLAELELEADGAPVSIRLSHYHSQRNVARMTFERCEVSFNVYDDRGYAVTWTSDKAPAATVRAHSEGHSAAELLLLNFLAAGEGREPAVCDAASSLPVIEVLDKAYREARRFPAALGVV